MADIDTDKVSAALRHRAINLEAKTVLITKFTGSEQEKDLSEPSNCDGHGRIHHFRRETSAGWPQNPLPVDPAANRLGFKPSNLLRAQLFQNAACNWRCWYCYVPFSLLAANPKKASWMSASELIDLYQHVENPPKVIDLSGGQPDLTPEWIVWMMRELKARGLQNKVYLWSDDNLSNDYLLRYLTNADLEFMRTYHTYGKVGCFKGFDDQSFAFNTGASPELFNRQFDVFRSHLPLGLDIYAYATFTSLSDKNIKSAMSCFVDKLQTIHQNLPLRTIPLEIRSFTPMQARYDKNAISIQKEAVELWNGEVEKRFSKADRELPIYEVSLSPN